MNITTSGITSPSLATGSTVTTTDNTNLSMDDFFELMVAQLQNQSMMDPVDNSESIAQMAQFTTLSKMEELAQVGQMSYAVSLIGKNVTVSSHNENGANMIASGMVDNVFYQSGIPYVDINGSPYLVSDVLKVENVQEVLAEEKIYPSDVLVEEEILPQDEIEEQ